jgi:hypothetical protein
MHLPHIEKKDEERVRAGAVVALSAVRGDGGRDLNKTTEKKRMNLIYYFLPS